MKEKVLVEVCCGSLEDVIIAKKVGAHRVELNSNMFLGGITPSIGTIEEAKALVDIPVMVMIRPRCAGFCYSEYEIKTMERDIKAAVKAGADGIVFGALKEDGTIDIELCKRFMDIIGDREAVFHRAFDVVKDPFAVLDILVDLGVRRILTKGQKNTIEDGAKLLMQLMEYAKGKIEILPGGVRLHNVKWMIEDMKFNQLHVASFTKRKDYSTQCHPEVYFGSPLNPKEIDYDIANYDYLKEMCDNIKIITKANCIK
ncbi:copper homeostasis protein CutC [Clostridium sp. UBA1056]|uniref:copper homeostasis protein CutC n=1 Tax=unclassified Clostridium TaxID=2614128 RepID=UPI0032175522